MTSGINSNVMTLLLNRSLNLATKSLNESLTRLSSGSKINSPKDDPSGFVIASGLKSQERINNAAQGSVQKTQSMLDVMDSSLSLILDQIDKIETLKVQSQDGNLSQAQKDSINSQIQSSIIEINNISDSAKYNGNKLFDGRTNDIEIYLTSSTDKAVLSKDLFGKVDASSISAKFTTTVTSDAITLDDIKAARDKILSQSAKIGATSSSLDATYDRLSTNEQSYSNAYSTVSEANVAYESARYTQSLIQQQAAAALLAQANQSKYVLLSLLPS